MNRRSVMRLASFGAVVVLAIAACSGSGSGSTSSGSASSGSGSSSASSRPAGPAGFNAAVTTVLNPVDRKTQGTISFGITSPPDSTDPGDTYYRFMWNFVQLYTMPLMTYKSCPGACGLQVVPDLATGPGVVSDNGLTWTYHIQPDVRFEDGTKITSADVKYAVERTYARGVLPLGPSYFPLLLAPQEPAYPGPYQDRSKNLMGLKAIQTPNPTTIVFHLAHPFADFNYVTAIPQTAPVPPDRDTGASYQLHPMSTGPYKFASYQPGKHLTLVPNLYWNPATDPNAKQLVSKITVTMNMSASAIDNGLLSGSLDVDLLGGDIIPTVQARILSSPSLRTQADDPFIGALQYAYLNTRVAPLNNVHCRIAIEYAASKVTLQTAYGGPYVGGAIASTVSPPDIVGHKNFDLYEAITKPQGDVSKAREQLKLCGRPNGFTTGVAYRTGRIFDAEAATALRAALSRAGIKLTLHGYPGATYFASYAGVPAYTERHDLGIAFSDWAADWPDGYGFLYYIADGAAISPSGNYNIEQLNDPVVNNDLTMMASVNNAAQRNAFTGQIDLQIMKDAAILPVGYAKLLLYRNPDLANVYVQPYYGMYDYAVLGLK